MGGVPPRYSSRGLRNRGGTAPTKQRHRKTQSHTKLTMNHTDLITIDMHTHAEVSCWQPFDAYGEDYDRAADN